MGRAVCLCVSSLQPKRMNRFWGNFTQIILSIFASVIFHGFWNFEFDDVIAAILHLRVAALSRSQFWSDFLQILVEKAHNSFIVWYWKSARSVNNFQSKKRTAFESHRCFGFRARLQKVVRECVVWVLMYRISVFWAIMFCVASGLL